MKQIDKNMLQQILKDRFGFSAFRDGQFEAIQTLLEKNRLICIQPTGHGKSLLYQLPSVLLPGITLVISPLLALMRDQLLHLTQRFNITAASINTDQTDEENLWARESARDGKIKILFVAPEQLDNLDRFNFLMSLPITLVVIDEAHCISTWGHDFRPSYRQIVKLVQQLEHKNSDIKILGLTATANHQTEDDIKLQLSIDKSIAVHRATMDRPNIQLSCVQLNTLEEKLKVVVDLISQLEGDGLIYCATRENTELVAEFCRLKNINAIAYHAGFDQNKKRELQHNFIRGKYKVIAATNALGMGIDKSDLRFIIHFDVPGSITAYYQEIGRCGRDGKFANAVLLFDEQDKKIQRHFIESAQPTADDFDLILKTIRDTDEPTTLNAIKRLTGLHPTRVQVVVAELAEQNFLEKNLISGKQIYRLTENKTPPNLTRYKNQYAVKINELDTMLRYGLQSTDCRMKMLRETLGDDFAKACGHCDICSGNLFFKIDLSDIKPISHWLIKKVRRLNPCFNMPFQKVFRY
ncbi:MAG: hypothetical protein A2103_04765 [Gammaproteobacteria bacterium GWF2_41_13]|nr:MAG: hypothetical protein A2103_04765 [Gammaproteobacteria bacterium GWF2_41_13]